MTGIVPFLFLSVAMLSDSECWNQGVDYYNNGDVTNALTTLRPLMLTKSHGARAAEIVAKLEYERGNLEEAANAAQIALRASPDDERVQRNFTRAIDQLPKMREKKHLAAIMKAAEGKDPGMMLKSSMEEARRIFAEAGTYRTNRAARAIAISDSLSSRAEKLADTWIPLRSVISQAVTNQEQAATIMLQIDQAESKNREAIKSLSDMDGKAYDAMSNVEHDFTRFFKLVALPPMAMNEDMIAQSNAWKKVEEINGRNWQQDALDYTRAFRTKFPAWARAYEQQAQADTNKPPFTVETQARISALATELEKLQIECTEKSVTNRQENAVSMIREIISLLPNDNSGSAGQSSSQDNKDRNKDNQNQNGQDQNQDQQNQSQAQDDDSKEDQPDGQSDQEQSPNEEVNEDQEVQQAEGTESDEDQKADDKELEALLKKAQERNDEHEADKRARMRKAQLAPNERDW